jgi:hypothetical protein
MKRETVIILAAVLFAAGPAFAQTDPDLPPAPNASPGDPNGNGSGALAVTAGTSAPGTWDSQLNNRPLVLDPGKLEVHGSVPIFTVSEPELNMAGMIVGTTTDTFEGLGLGATYGIMPKLEGGLDYTIPLNPNGSASGVLGLRAAFAAMHTDKMDLAISAALDFDFHDGNDVALQLGGWFRYRINPKISVFTGNPGLPYELGFLGALGNISTNQLALGFGNGQAISLALPVGVGLQATPQIYAFAAINLADFYFTNGPKSVDLLFADFIPLEIGAFYSMNSTLDLGITFSDDLEHAGDYFALALAARYFVK